MRSFSIGPAFSGLALVLLLATSSASILVASPQDVVMKEIIQSTSIAAGVPPLLMLTICTQESNLKPNATGDGGKSHGLCQLKRIAAEAVLGHKIPKKEIRPPVINSYLSGQYLLKCYAKLGSWIQAIDCYRRGPSKARRYNRVRQYPKGSMTRWLYQRWYTLEMQKVHADENYTPLIPGLLGRRTADLIKKMHNTEHLQKK